MEAEGFTGPADGIPVAVKPCADLDPSDEMLSVEVECRVGWGIATFRVANPTTGEVSGYTLLVDGLEAFVDIELSSGLFLAGDHSLLAHNMCPVASGLKNASAGMQGLFADGSIRGKSIIGIRTGLLDNGFSQTLVDNKSGYLFRNALGEEVRVMSRGGGWDVRVKNQYGNYLDEFGNVAASPSAAHGIGVVSK